MVDGNTGAVRLFCQQVNYMLVSAFGLLIFILFQIDLYFFSFMDITGLLRIRKGLLRVSEFMTSLYPESDYGIENLMGLW